VTSTTRDGTVTGRRIVAVLYVVLVGVGTVAGVLVSVFVENLSRPELFGFLALPATPLGFAVFGGVTIAVVLGVPLSLVIYAARNVDDPHAVGDDD
jgi:hypothetical protein